MKKLTLLLSVLTLTGTIFAQSQRLPLVEELTQASCGPCAAQNPAFNSLITANPGKIMSIKYQTSWPGVDPMNAQNPTEVATRVSYYGVTGVPNINFDGTIINNGAPSDMTQGDIDSEYGTTSPFDINLTHSFSSDLDSVFITMIINCTQNVSGPLRGHIALVERHIHFNAAPGSNGEKDFYNVMRKMYPSASGTVLATSWTAGQADTLTFSGPIPSYIYNMNEIAIVGFIQDNTSKNVKQAAISSPLTLPTSIEDAGITANALPVVQCVSTVTPTITLKNYSANTLTSCTINYKLDNGTVMTQAWTGSIATNATASVALPSMNIAVGSHTLVTYTSMPNGNTDYFLNNNTYTKKFNIIGSPAAAPLVESFTATTFPPTNWVVSNPDNTYTWNRVTNAGGFAATGQSTRLDFFNSPSGQIDELYLEPIDLTTSNNGANMTFDVAYAQYAAENDKLQVMVSTNCGSTWTTLYTKAGTTLKTAPPVTTSFTPNATQWRTETVNLANFLNQSNVLIKLKGTSNYGNNLYVDNINVQTYIATGIEEVNSNNISLNVYPNPITNDATVEFNLTEANNVSVVMYDVLGEAVFTSVLGNMNIGDHNLKLNAQDFNSGIYFITLNAGQNKITKKVVINK